MGCNKPDKFRVQVLRYALHSGIQLLTRSIAGFHSMLGHRLWSPLCCGYNHPVGLARFDDLSTHSAVPLFH